MRETRLEKVALHSVCGARRVKEGGRARENRSKSELKVVVFVTATDWAAEGSLQLEKLRTALSNQPYPSTRLGCLRPPLWLSLFSSTLGYPRRN